MIRRNLAALGAVLLLGGCYYPYYGNYGNPYRGYYRPPYPSYGRPYGAATPVSPYTATPYTATPALPYAPQSDAAPQEPLGQNGPIDLTPPPPGQPDLRKSPQYSSPSQNPPIQAQPLEPPQPPQPQAQDASPSLQEPPTQGAPTEPPSQWPNRYPPTEDSVPPPDTNPIDPTILPPHQPSQP